MCGGAAEDGIQKIKKKWGEGSAKPDKPAESAAIRKVCQKGEMRTVKSTKVDLCLENNGEMYLLDLKTAKPNMAGFIDLKRTLLEWVAKVLAENPGAKINTLIAIPYNPYAPAKYTRWTMAGMLDFKSEFKVAEGFWAFLGGEGAYDGLLDCFERAGIEMRDEIDAFFSKFKAR